MEFIRVKYLSLCHANPKKFVHLENLYLEIKGNQCLSDLKESSSVSQTEIDQFLKSCLNFFIDVWEIKIFDFSDPIFKRFTLVEPKEARALEQKSLKTILDRFYLC